MTAVVTAEGHVQGGERSKEQAHHTPAETPAAKGRPVNGSRFDRDTAVRRCADGVFEARIDPGWWIVRGPNGGYLAAIVLRALAAAVDDPDRAPRSLSCHFSAPPRAGRVRVTTHLERVGRSLTTVSGRMWQDDRLCVAALAAFSKHRDAPEFQDMRMPAVPPPEEAQALRVGESHGVPMRDRYDQRALAHGLPAAAGQAVTGGWMRLADPYRADAAVVAAFCDAWPPAIRQRTEAPLVLGVPTVDLTVHFRRTLPVPDTRPDDFYLAVYRTRMAMEGFLEEDAEIWSRDGRLLAHSRQLGVLV